MSKTFTTFLCSLAVLLLAALAQAEVPAAPVMFQGETLFEIRAPFGAFTPADRAAAIAERLETLARQLQPVRIEVVAHESFSEIRSGAVVIMAITAADAVAAEQGRDNLATTYARRMEATVVKTQAEHSVQYLRQSWLYTAAATVALALFLFGLAVLGASRPTEDCGTPKR